MRTAAPLLLLAISACKLTAPTMPDRLVDLDNDGYTEVEGDCQPTNADVYPGADEVCDGEDNDCDGSTDEADALDASTWYLDSDGDNYGDPESSLVACDKPQDHVANDEDCDDDDETVAPNTTDDCDGTDSDCDGVADDDADTVWYEDGDDDGYGDPMRTSCEDAKPSGFVANHDDCDDTEPDVHPGALEFCNGEDDDCDGTPDNDAFDAPTWCRDSDGDAQGSPLETVIQCDLPASGGYIADCTDCDDSNNGVGGPEECRIPDTWRLSDDGAGPDAELQGGSSQKVGWSLAVGNIDGNETHDLLIAYLESGEGRVDLVLGTGSRPAGAYDLSNAAALTLPVDANGYSSKEFGTSIQIVPDANSDGWREIFVGDPDADSSSTSHTGAVYMYRSAEEDYALHSRFVGADSDDRAGARLAYLPWFYGLDQYLATSAPGASAGDGVVYVAEHSGASPGEYLLSTVASAITSIPESGIEFGAGLASVWMADYWPALVVGATSLPGPPADPRGGVFVFRGRPGALPYTFINDAEVKIGGEPSSGGHFGSAIANAGDVNDDGYQDILVGAPDFSSVTRNQNGRAYLISGDLEDGEWSLATLDAAKRIATFNGAHSGAHVGAVLAGNGNVDGDPYADIALGVPDQSFVSEDGAGTVFLFYGGPDLGGTHDLLDLTEDGRARLFSTHALDQLGAAVSLRGNLDGDAYDDLAIGSPGDTSDAGTTYLLFGEGF